VRKQPIVTFQEVARVLGPVIDGHLNAGGQGGAESLQADEAAVKFVPAESMDKETLAAAMKLVGRALQEIERADSGDGMLNTATDEVTSLLQTFIAQQADEVDAPPLPIGGFEAKFDPKDVLGWIGSFFQWWRKLKPHPWPTATDEITDLGDRDLRIGMLADWGTGLYGAPECAKRLEEDSKGFDLLIHLGDVYYSGTKHEIRKRFLPYWPKKARLAHLALNSNHEMYSGGWGYFDVTLPKFAEMSTAFKQSTSYFAVANKHFTLIGLDTGYKDDDLAGEQAAWLQRIIGRSEAYGRRVILMSHHQPFSAFEGNGDKTVKQLAGLLGGKKILAWYFGHEHRLVVYDRHPDWDMYGRCIGHGGMPYLRDKIAGATAEETAMYRIPGREKGGIRTPQARVLDGPNPYVGEGRLKYGPNGYAVLELIGKQIHESYRLPDGKEILAEVIS
jgi:hypothetical protein